MKSLNDRDGPALPLAEDLEGAGRHEERRRKGQGHAGGHVLLARHMQVSDLIKRNVGVCGRTPPILMQ